MNLLTILNINFTQKLDLIENKHKLGIKKNQSIKINLVHYKFCLKKLLNGKEISSKNVLLASTAVYEILLGRNIFKKKYFYIIIIESKL